MSYVQVPTELRDRMRKAGVTIKEVSVRTKRPYGTLGVQLGGFTPLDETVRATIELMIKEKTEVGSK